MTSQLSKANSAAQINSILCSEVNHYSSGFSQSEPPGWNQTTRQSNLPLYLY